MGNPFFPRLLKAQAKKRDLLFYECFTSYNPVDCESRNTSFHSNPSGGMHLQFLSKASMQLLNISQERRYFVCLLCDCNPLMYS
mmetsp:Transcript_10011/g.14630  ORF Transcript_10011/g.14630 Transcript_10011/m.14630 type:complete len:84 (+) Transcript_10011:129-380(+)